MPHETVYRGGPLDGEIAETRRGRLSIYRTPEGEYAPAQRGDRLYVSPFNRNRPVGEIYVHQPGERAYVWAPDLAKRHGKTGDGS